MLTHTLLRKFATMYSVYLILVPLGKEVKNVFGIFQKKLHGYKTMSLRWYLIVWTKIFSLSILIN